MNLYAGTSGFSYPEWKGRFYPEDLPEKQMLRFYGERFGSVEINNTFYRMPKPAVLESWAGEVGAHFRFVLKAPQRITHRERLKESGESVAYFLKVAVTLQERLGPILFQLPPFLRKDLPRLREFLDLLPREHRFVFEFRHASWFDSEVIDLLRAHRIALCLAEAEDGLEVPFTATTDWGYVRLRRPDYSEDDLAAWVDRIRQAGWSDVFVFFKHEEEGKGPEMAQRFLALAGKAA